LTEAAKAFLVLASLFFYSWWDIAYLPLILISMLFNYSIGTSLTRNNKNKSITKKSLLITGIVANVALLGYFKYADFFITNVNTVFGSQVPLLHLALPLAISFFTFQQIAYLVDSYKLETKEYDFINYAVFVSFFPQLIAGPIVHHKEMMPQFAQLRSKIINYRNIFVGLFIFFMGLFKKVVIADTFAIWATNGFDNLQVLTFFEAWATSLSYSFQLYFDFSGYTDMAIGAALMFNIKLPLNFNSPYKARNIQDFWRRWHITLSRFLRDYIYIPLGGNRKGSLRTYSNLMATFLIGGLWHGAGWTFIFWGFLHGAALVIHRAWSRLGIRLGTFLSWLITFFFINITWVFFRAKEWEDAIKVLKGMFGLNGIALHPNFEPKLAFLKEFGVTFKSLPAITNQYEFIAYFLAASIILFLKNSNHYLENLKPNIYTSALFIAMALYSILSLNKLSEFLYYQF
jgi:D-alanyl-lipoteichoic acid acyltransferase DltB (MBOAT superfamily)